MSIILLFDDKNAIIVVQAGNIITKNPAYRFKRRPLYGTLDFNAPLSTFADRACFRRAFGRCGKDTRTLREKIPLHTPAGYCRFAPRARGDEADKQRKGRQL